jgi:methyl-accepting chemotaxis protein
VAGDLFIKHMDWPGAQEMAKRFAKTIDPKLLSDEDDPALQAANQQMQAMSQEMQQMQQMLQNVSQSMEAQTLKVKEFEAEVKAYDAETKRISAVQAGMSEEQIQDIAMGVVAAALESQGMMNQMPDMREESMPMEMMQPDQMPPLGMEQMPPPQGMPQ